MRKFFVTLFIAYALFLASCDERPSERRARSFSDDEKSESRRGGALSESRQIQFTNQTALRLDIEYNGGYLTIERDDTGLLADINLDFDHEENRPYIDFDSSSATPTLRIKSPRRHEHNVSFDRFRDNDWLIKLSSKIPIDFRIAGGALEANFDFTGLKVADLDVSVGAGELRLDFGEPNSERPDLRINSGAAETKAKGLCNANFRRIEFNGGVGASNLSFDGEWKSDGRVDMNLGVGKNTILLARHIGAKVHPAGSFLSPISLHGFDKRNGMRYSENYEDAIGHLDFDIKMGVGHTSIDWID